MKVSEDKALMPEWNWDRNIGISPYALKCGSNRKVWWKCAKGHEWEATVYKRTTRDSGCPYCAHRKTLVGFNDLATLYPLLASEWDRELNGNLLPSQFTRKSTQTIHWKCSTCGYRWVDSIRLRAQKGKGCPECGRRKGAENHSKTIRERNGSLADEPVAAEWNHERNGNLKPEDFSRKSSRKVWWKCRACGHEWQTSIGNRVSGRGCPSCAHRALVKGVNDLKTANPELAAEWHPTKNGDLQPCDVFARSGLKVWWRCPLGHEYQATLLSRSQGTNCPICNSGSQTSFAEQAIFYYISQAHPDAISRCTSVLKSRMELDVYIPCLGIAIEYDGAFWHRPATKERERRKYQLCQKKGIYLIRIKECNTDEAMETADEIFSGNLENRQNLAGIIQFLLDRLDSRSNPWTRRDARHMHSPIHVNLALDRFQILGQYLKCKKRDSLAEQHPQVAAEWHPSKNGNLMPDMFLPGSDERVWWKCPVCGCEWEASIAHRIGKQGTGCPACGIRKSVHSRIQKQIERNGSLAEEPVSMEWNHERNGRLKPELFARQSEKSVWWRCAKCGYEWRSKINNRVNGRGCPLCANKVLVQGRNDLATVHPELTDEWLSAKNGSLSPDKVKFCANRKVWWKCARCGHEWQKSIALRSRGVGCPLCARSARAKARCKTIIARQGSLGDSPVAAEWNHEKNGQLQPEGFSRGSNKIVWWKCPRCGHEWQASICSRTSGSGCPVCSGQAVLKGFNDLATKRPDLAAEWHPTKNGELPPEQFPVGSGKRVWWRCATCGHEWRTSVSHRTSGKATGCPECSKRKLSGGNSPLARKIYQYSRDGILIREWPSIAEASDALSIKRAAIVHCAQHKTKSSGGFRWEYAKLAPGQFEQLPLPGL